jgi:hypothetical protein
MSQESFMKGGFHGVITEDLIVPYPALGAEEAESVQIILDSSS